MDFRVSDLLQVAVHVVFTTCHLDSESSSCVPHVYTSCISSHISIEGTLAIGFDKWQLHSFQFFVKARFRITLRQTPRDQLLHFLVIFVFFYICTGRSRPSDKRRGGGASKPWDKGGGTVLKKFRFGPNIRWGKGGGRAPRDPPLEPPIICTPSCQWFHICTVLICVHSKNNVCQFEADFCRELGSKYLYPTTLTFRLISILLMNRFYDNKLVSTKHILAFCVLIFLILMLFLKCFLK